MAISSELSSEIAAALLAAKNKSPRELDDLKEIVLRIHNTLQQMTNRSRVNLKESERVSEEVSRES
jgi:hypothetical protein